MKWRYLATNFFKFHARDQKCHFRNCQFLKRTPIQHFHSCFLVFSYHMQNWECILPSHLLAFSNGVIIILKIYDIWVIIRQKPKVLHCTGAIISRGLYIFYPIFHLGLYILWAVSVTEINILNKENSSIFVSKIPGL